MDTKFDNQEIYCRKLGHYLTFKYCRQEYHMIPCSKIRECWFARIHVDQFLAQNFNEKEIVSIVHPAKPKISAIVELIQQVKNNSDQV
jgi:hypothetical protein